MPQKMLADNVKIFMSVFTQCMLDMSGDTVLYRLRTTGTFYWHICPRWYYFTLFLLVCEDK